MKRFEQQIGFIIEIDKLKSVLRRSRLIHDDRYENSAEHSWHFAVMAFVLAEHYPHTNQLNMLRVLKMALVHDLIEVYAGDTYCYDDVAKADAHARELEAANRLFSLLPPDQHDDIFCLWNEFETGTSHEARFARVIDRLNPFMLNFYSGGISWKANLVKRSQVIKRMEEIKSACPEIYRYVEELIAEAISNRWIIDDSRHELHA